MTVQDWETKTSGVIYRKFQAGESLVGGLEDLAKANGIKEAMGEYSIASSMPKELLQE